MKFKCLKTVIHMGKIYDIGDIIDIDEKTAKESPSSFSKIELRKKKDNGNNPIDTDKHDN